MHFFHSLCHYHTFAICLHDIKRDQLLQKEEWCNPFSYPLNKLQHQRMKAFFTPMQSATYSINLHNGVKFFFSLLLSCGSGSALRSKSVFSNSKRYIVIRVNRGGLVRPIEPPWLLIAHRPLKYFDLLQQVWYQKISQPITLFRSYYNSEYFYHFLVGGTGD